ANGDWLQFLDADDELLTNKFEKSVQIIADNDEIDVICSYARYVNRDGKEREIKGVEHDVWLGLIKSRLGCTISNFFKKDTLLKSRRPVFSLRRGSGAYPY